MVFSELGDVEKIELAKDPVTGAGRGYAYLKCVLLTCRKRDIDFGFCCSCTAQNR